MGHYGKSIYEIFRRPTCPRKDHPEDDEWKYLKAELAYSDKQAVFFAKKNDGSDRKYQYKAVIKVFKESGKKDNEKEWTDAERAALGERIKRYLFSVGMTQLDFVKNIRREHPEYFIYKSYSTDASAQAKVSLAINNKLPKNTWPEVLNELEKYLNERTVVPSDREASRGSIRSRIEDYLVGHKVTQEEFAKLVRNKYPEGSFARRYNSDPSAGWLIGCMRRNTADVRSEKFDAIWEEVGMFLDGDSCEAKKAEESEAKQMEIKNETEVAKEATTLLPNPAIVRITMDANSYKSINILANASGVTLDKLVSKLCEREVEKYKDVVSLIEELREEYD